jgi:hypothetical protein
VQYEKYEDIPLSTNPADLHFYPFLYKGTTAAHQMGEKIINKALYHRK